MSMAEPQWQRPDELEESIEGGKVLEKFLQVDSESPEIFSLISQFHNVMSRASDEQNAPFQKVMQTLSHTVPFPEQVQQGISGGCLKAEAGLFTEVKRAWVSIDNRLYLWNLEDGGDFQAYDGLDQVIVAVALVTPKADVFIDTIQHLLVLATPVEVVVIGVSFEGPMFETMHLLPTDLAVSSDGVQFQKIVGTKNGRVFMCGVDGCLYELVYQAQNSWFSRKCRKLNHSQTPLSGYVPSFLKFGSADSIEDMVVDDSRNILYTKTRSSVVAVYDMGEDGNGMRHVTSSTSTSLGKELDVRGGSKISIIGLFPVPATESRNVHLVAVTDSGMRLYFSTVQRSWDNRSGVRRPNTLELIHARDRGRSQGEVKDCLYSNGVLLLSGKKEFVAFAVDTSRPQVQSGMHASTQLSSKALQESISSLDIDGTVWSMAELDAADTNSTQLLSLKKPSTALYEVATQHLLPRRKFVLITDTGISFVTKSRPVDDLREILEASCGSDHHQISNFIIRYGKEQMCAMCLVIACSTSSAHDDVRRSSMAVQRTPYASPTPSTTFRNANESGFLSPHAGYEDSVKEWAVQAFFKYGGDPSFIIPAQEVVGGTSYAMGGPMATPGLKYSASHDGLCLYFARLVRPIWNSTVVVSSTREKDLYHSRWSREELQTLLLPLYNLRSFFDKNYRNIFDEHESNSRFNAMTMKERLISNARKTQKSQAHGAEKKSLRNLYNLLNRVLQGILLLQLLTHYHLPRLVARLRSDEKDSLVRMAFGEIITESGSPTVARALINELVQQNSSSSQYGDICGILRKDCPLFFSEVDMKWHKGWDMLERAKKASDKTRLLQESLDQFLQIASQVPSIGEVCRTYQDLEFFPAIVDLVMARTSDNTAGGSLADNEADREKCYNYVLDVFDMLNGARYRGATDPVQVRSVLMNKILKSTNREFHEAMYRWYVEVSLETALFEISSSFIEPFLESNEPHLYAEYLKRKGKYDKAAESYFALASLDTSDGANSNKKFPNLDIESRTNYLSQALHCARSCNSFGIHIDNGILVMYEESMEVAHVQSFLMNELSSSYFTRSGEQDTDERTAAQQNTELVELKKGLNSRLFTVSELFNDWASPYELLESQLKLIEISLEGERFQDRVRDLLREIIDKSCAGGDIRITIDRLVSQFGRNPTIFPLDYVVEYLERHCNFNSDQNEKDWVINTLKESSAGFSFAKLWEAYDGLAKNETDLAFKRHLLARVAVVLDKWLLLVNSGTTVENNREMLRIFPDLERSIAIHAQDLTTMGGASADLTKDELRRLQRGLQDWQQRNFVH